MSSETSTNLQPWQFFVLAGLACATTVTFMLRGQGVLPVILLSAAMGASVLAGLAALRTIRPLVTEQEERAATMALRTRAALEREKLLALRAIKELEFDRAMGKLSEPDFQEMAGRLRARATRLIRQLDAGDGYRSRIENDLEARLRSPQDEEGARERSARSGASTEVSRERLCASCSTVNDTDARFCKQCGAKL
jgi:hypothetical protein